MPSISKKEIQGWYYHPNLGIIPCTFIKVMTKKDHPKCHGMIMIQFVHFKNIVNMIIYPKSFIHME